MGNTVWEIIFRSIPLEYQNKLSLVTISGAEIAVQGIFRIDKFFVAIKGRIAGSTDGGRLFFVPYQQIDYLGSQNEIKDNDFQEVFGNVIFDDAASAVYSGTTSDSDPTGPVASNAAGFPNGAHGSNQGSEESVPPTPPVPIRSAVLERFRARSNMSSTDGSVPRPTDSKH